MKCPDCGGAVEYVNATRDGGAIEETVIGRDFGLHRRVRPASFYACTGCEWCSELAPRAVEDDDDEKDDTEDPDGARCTGCGEYPTASGCRCDDDHERAAAHARQNDFEDTGGKDWT